MKSSAGMTPPSVLLVEDDPDIVLALSDLLAEEGFDVRTARDGRSASAMLETVPRPCVVLLDLNMPVMNGSDLLEAIALRADCTDFRVVLMSASPGIRAAAFQAARARVARPGSSGLAHHRPDLTKAGERRAAARSWHGRSQSRTDRPRGMRLAA